MFNLKTVAAVAAVTMSVGALFAEDLTYKSPDYTATYFSGWLKNSGLIYCKLQGKTDLVMGSNVFATLKDAQGKAVNVTEKAQPVYTLKDNVFSHKRVIVKRNSKDTQEEFAEVSRTIKFEPAKYTVSVSIKNLKDITFKAGWTTYFECVSVVTQTLAGLRLEGIPYKGQTVRVLIPKKYNAKNWSFRDSHRQLRFVGEKFTLIVTAQPGTSLSFNNYGGKNCEIMIRGTLPDKKLTRKAGEVYTLGYTVEFAKGE